MLRLYIYDKGQYEEGQYVVLPKDVSITVKKVNPIFNLQGGGEFSEKVKLSASANRHLLGIAEHLNGETLYQTLNGKRFLLYVGGVPSMHGSVYMDNECSIEEDTFEIELAGGNTDFDDMVGNINCKDVQIMPDEPQEEDYDTYAEYDAAHRNWEKEMSALYIGECLTKFKVEYTQRRGSVHVVVRQRWKDNDPDEGRETVVNKRIEKTDIGSAKTVLEYELPSKGLFRFEGANFSQEYVNTPNKKQFFCNVRVCGQRYIPVDSQGNTVEGDNPDVIDDWEEQRAYMSSDGATGSTLDNYGVWNTWGMAPSFFVLYFLEKLFSQLGLKYDISKLMEIEDLRRLAFVNTNPRFDMEVGDGAPERSLYYESIDFSIDEESLQNAANGWTPGSVFDITPHIKVMTSGRYDSPMDALLAEQFFGKGYKFEGADIDIDSLTKQNATFMNKLFEQ